MNITKLQAQDRIRAGNLEGYDYNAIHELYLTAFEDKELADQAKLAAMERLVRESCNAATQ